MFLKVQYTQAQKIDFFVQPPSFQDALTVPVLLTSLLFYLYDTQQIYLIAGVGLEQIVMFEQVYKYSFDSKRINKALWGQKSDTTLKIWDYIFLK